MSTSSTALENENEKEKEIAGLGDVGGDGDRDVIGNVKGDLKRDMKGLENGERAGVGDGEREGEEEVEGGKYMQGWRLWCLVFGLCLSLLLSTLETTIVSTSLVSITNALSGFENRDWIVTSYLLTYTGFLVIYAKFSGIFGVKFMILLALVMFTVFSIVCGAATGMTELIILRAFQGIGGSGIYSMVGVVVTVVVRPGEYGKYMAVISSVFVISSVLGPILGGVINDKSTWRWVFLLNAPAGISATILVALFLPSDFSSTSTSLLRRLRARFTLQFFARLDLTGATLMLAASILLVFALEEAGTRYSWGSAPIIVTLVVSVLCWIGFVGWEMRTEKKFGEAKRDEKGNGGVREPVFKMGLLKNRVLAGMLLNAFLTGIPFTTLVVSIPQSLQTTKGLTPTHAGLALLPLLLMTPFSSALSSILATNKKTLVPPIYLVLIGSILQLLGVAMFTTLSTNPDVGDRIEGKMYAFEVLMGLGFGLVLTSLLGFIPLIVTKSDMPVIIGAVTQVRVLGGTIGLAISTVILNSFVKTKLREQLSASQISAISQSLTDGLEGLTEEEVKFVKGVFLLGYNRIWVFVAGFSSAVVASVFIMWERKPRRMVVNEKGEVDGPKIE